MQQQFNFCLQIRQEQKSGPTAEHIPTWLVFLAYLAYLRAMRPQPPTEVVVLRTLIIIVGLVLVVVALVAAGSPEMAAKVIQHWPIIP